LTKKKAHEDCQLKCRQEMNNSSLHKRNPESVFFVKTTTKKD